MPNYLGNHSVPVLRTETARRARDQSPGRAPHSLGTDAAATSNPNDKAHALVRHTRRQAGTTRHGLGRGGRSGPFYKEQSASNSKRPPPGSPPWLGPEIPGDGTPSASSAGSVFFFKDSRCTSRSPASQCSSSGPLMSPTSDILSLCSGDGFVLYYSNLSARCDKILSFLNREDYPVCKALRSTCFTLAMADDLAMYAALADTALFSQQQSSQGLLQEDACALEHYTSSLRLMHERLVNAPNAAADEIIGSVLILATYDFRIRNFTRVTIHMNAIKQMISSRGGLEMLSSAYLQMTLIWLDIVTSISMDAPPRFRLPRCTLLQDINYPPSPLLDQMLQSLRKSSADLLDVCKLLEHTSALIGYVSIKPPRYWHEDVDLMHSLSVLIYDVLNLPRFYEENLLAQHAKHNNGNTANCRPAAGLVMREVLRLALLLFLTAPANFLAGNGHLRLSYRGKLPNLFRTQAHVLDWAGLDDLLLWILAIDVTVEIGDNKQWALEQLKNTINNLRLTRGKLEWTGILDILRRVAWIDGVMSSEMDELQALLFDAP